MNPSAYDLSELRDAAGVRERGGALESVQSATAERRRGLPPRIRGDEHRDETRYRELLARELELAGDPDPPYLRQLPRSYVGTTTVLDWADFLVRKAGPAGAREAVAFYEQQGWLVDPAASSVRSHLDAVDSIFLSINLGSTNLEACAYRRGEQLAPFATGGITGNEVDRRIVAYVEEETQGRVKVDITTAREYKEDQADFENFESFTDIIQQPGGGAYEFTIEDSVMDAVDEYLDEVVETVANDFLPELANDYMKVYQLALDERIVLTGGMACIPGLVEEFQRRLSEELQRDVEATAADRPDLAAAEGAQRIAEQLLLHQD